MLKNLYQELREENPRKFRVDIHNSLDTDINKRNKSNPCSGCLVEFERSPEHCDPCLVNPDRERLKRSGLL